MNNPFRKAFIDNDNRFSFKGDTYTGKLYIDTLYYESGQIKAIGSIAVDNYADTSNIKIGFWREYHQNGRVKQEGNYQIGSFLQCCTFGHCRMYYNHKEGTWNYWYANGQLKAQGIYVKAIQAFQTSCEGGDKVVVHKVDSKWQYFDKQGNVLEVSDTLVKELEDINFYRFGQ